MCRQNPAPPRPARGSPARRGRVASPQRPRAGAGGWLPSRAEHLTRSTSFSTSRRAPDRSAAARPGRPADVPGGSAPPGHAVAHQNLELQQNARARRQGAAGRRAPQRGCLLPSCPAAAAPSQRVPGCASAPRPSFASPFAAAPYAEALKVDRSVNVNFHRSQVCIDDVLVYKGHVRRAAPAHPSGEPHEAAARGGGGQSILFTVDRCPRPCPRRPRRLRPLSAALARTSPSHVVAPLSEMG